jgi:hypothetical protein
MLKRTHPLVVLTVLVALSLATALVLFGVLSSTGVIENGSVQFGGAAAGFFGTLIPFGSLVQELGGQSSGGCSFRGKEQNSW